MNKLLLYILLLCSPVLVTAQVVIDTVVETETFTEAAPKQAPPLMTVAPVYRQRKFETGFKKKYTDTDFKYEVKTTGKTWLERFFDWLAHLLDRIFGNNGKKNEGINWGDLILKILAVAVIGLVVYFIVRAIVNKESMWIFGRSRKKIKVQDADEENIHEMDFNTLIEDTRAAGNYRLAVRYYYLWLLKKLSARDIIEWNWEKTNSDYLYEIQNTALREEFEYLSYLYDHSWYGDFPIDDKAFAKAEKAFLKTFNTL